MEIKSSKYEKNVSYRSIVSIRFLIVSTSWAVKYALFSFNEEIFLNNRSL